MILVLILRSHNGEVFFLVELFLNTFLLFTDWDEYMLFKFNFFWLNLDLEPILTCLNYIREHPIL